MGDIGIHQNLTSNRICNRNSGVYVHGWVSLNSAQNSALDIAPNHTLISVSDNTRCTHATGISYTCQSVFHCQWIIENHSCDLTNCIASHNLNILINRRNGIVIRVLSSTLCPWFIPVCNPYPSTIQIQSQFISSCNRYLVTFHLWTGSISCHPSPATIPLGLWSISGYNLACALIQLFPAIRFHSLYCCAYTGSILCPFLYFSKSFNCHHYGLPYCPSSIDSSFQFHNPSGDLLSIIRYYPLTNLSMWHGIFLPKSTIQLLEYISFHTIAAILLHSTKLNAVQINSIKLNSIQLNSIQLNSIQLSSIQLNSIQLNSIQLNSIQLNSIQLNSIQLNSNTLLIYTYSKL